MKEGVKYRRTAAQLCYLLGPHFSRWRFSKGAMRRLTPFQVSHWLAERVSARWGSAAVLWDAFANIGSDAEKFAEHLQRVICSELCGFDTLAENISMLGRANLEARADVDYANPRTWPRADIVYLNPSWGPAYDRVNRDYFDISKVSIGAMSFAELFERARRRYHVVVVTPSKGVDFAEQYPSDDRVQFAQLTFHFYDREA